jgi:flagellar M-ring protein FliF
MRLLAIAIVAVSLFGFFGFITTRITASPLALLYSELDQQDSSAIVQKLDGMKVPYEVNSTGSLIRVQSDQVGKLRMMMAADGLPKGGSVGYEIFDQKEGFGTTSFVQSINQLRALEGELARTIGALDPIQSARVHLVLPQRELFSHSTQNATASIFLKTRGGAVLTREQIAAIQHLIASAVPQLQPNQVSIVDDRGNLLAKPSENSDSASADEADDMRTNFEAAQTKKIEDLLDQTLGAGKARAKVSAEMDFDRITTSSEVYDPDSQVARSTQTTSDETSAAEGGNQPVTIANNLPANPAQIANPNAGGGSNNKNSHNEETTNYEINKTVRNQVREGGQIRRLSVAVVVDGSYKAAEVKVDDKAKKDETAAAAAPTYVPRTDDEMKKIHDLVASAVNFDPARGDTLTVTNMQFATPEIKDEGTDAGLLMGVPKSDLFHAVETLILSLIGLLVVLLVVRPILRKILDTAGTAAPEQQTLLSGGSAAATAQLPAPGGGSALEEAGAAESEIERMIDISRVEGRVKASSLRKVGEIVDKHPDEAVAILRNWMYQEQR